MFHWLTFYAYASPAEHLTTHFAWLVHPPCSRWFLFFAASRAGCELFEVHAPAAADALYAAIPELYPRISSLNGWCDSIAQRPPLRPHARADARKLRRGSSDRASGSSMRTTVYGRVIGTVWTGDVAVLAAAEFVIIARRRHSDSLG